MSKQCIVIFYSGTQIDAIAAAQIASALASHVHEGASEPTIKAFNENEMAKEIARCAIPPHLSNEEGDASVAVVMGQIPVDCLDNNIKLSVALTKVLSIAETRNSTVDKAFINAMSILAQDYPVSKAVASKWHFNKTIRSVIKQVYQNYING